MSTVTFAPAGPVSRAWMEDDAFVKALVGPLGSGKTSAAVVEILRRAMGQAPGPDGVRRVRVACIRNTFADLKTTTIKSWAQWCPPQFGKLTMGGSPIIHHIQSSDLDMEVLFIPLDKDEDVRKLLSLELSFAWIDECREIPKTILDALTGRVGRYPGRLQGGCTWSGVLLTSNPSDQDAWLAKMAGDPPEGWKVYRQPSGRSNMAENLENLPQNYYSRMVHGKDEDWVRCYVDGQWAYLSEGKPVYSSWRDSAHVAAERIVPPTTLGLTIGADFGLTPAAVICCQYADGRIVVVDELVAEDTGITRFSETLTAYMKQNYPDHQVVSAIGDPAGTARGQSDERTVFEILNQRTPWRWRPASTNEITLRIEAVSAALNRMVDGKPGFQLNPGCSILRRGFSSGYHFQKVASGNGATFHESPSKNQYSHPHDALQYALLGMGGADAVLNRDKRRNLPRVADGVDYPMFDVPPGTSARGNGVAWGNGRPDFGKRSGPATSAYNIFD